MENVDRFLFDKEQNVFVYIYKIPKNLIIEKLLNKKRQEEIDKCDNQEAKKQKYFIWVKLENILKNAFNVNISNLFKNENNKLTCNDYFISLSHSKDMVAFAISKTHIGIDIEIENIDNKKIITHILDNDELILFNENKYSLNYFWTRKEAYYKFSNEKIFKPKEINVLNKNIKTYVIGEDYTLSIASQHEQDISISLNDISGIEEIK